MAIIGSPSNKDRNPVLNPTILSGDAGTKADSLDNINHVVAVMQADGKYSCHIGISASADVFMALAGLFFSHLVKPFL